MKPNFRGIRAICSLLLLIWGPFVFSQTKDNQKVPYVNGEVLTMKALGDTMFIGGSFTAIRHADSAIHHLYILDSSLTELTPLPLRLLNRDGSIKEKKLETMISDGHGGWLISGDFIEVGDSVRKHVAQIDSNGHVTAMFSGLEFSKINGNYPVKIKRFGDTLFIVGTKLELNQNEEFLFVKELEDSTLFYERPYSGNLIQKAIPDDEGGYYLTGDFASYKNLRANGLVRIDTAGNVVQGFLQDIDVNSSQAFLGHSGNQLLFNGNAKLLTLDTISERFDGGLNVAGTGIAASNTEKQKLLCKSFGSEDYYISGIFDFYGNQKADGLVHVDSNGQVHPWFGTAAFHSEILTSAANSTHFFAIRNTFDEYAGGDAQSLFIYNKTNGQLVKRFREKEYWNIYRVAVTEDYLFLAGSPKQNWDFVVVKVYDIHTLVEDVSKRMVFDSYLTAMEARGDYLFISGSFTSINENSHSNFAVLRLSDFSFLDPLPNLNYPVRAFDLTGDYLYFLADTVGGASNYVLKGHCYNLATELYTAWNVTLLSENYTFSDAIKMMVLDSGIWIYSYGVKVVYDSIVGVKRTNASSYLLNKIDGSLVKELNFDYLLWAVKSNGYVNAAFKRDYWKNPAGQYEFTLVNKTTGEMKETKIANNLLDIKTSSFNGGFILYSTSQVTVDGINSYIHILDTSGNRWPNSPNTYPTRKAMVHDTIIFIHSQNSWSRNYIFMYGIQSGQLLGNIHFNRDVSDFAISNDTLYIIGEFTFVNSENVARNKIASFALPNLRITNLGSIDYFPEAKFFSLGLTSNYIHVYGEFIGIGQNFEIRAKDYARLNRSTGIPDESGLKLGRNTWIKEIVGSGNNVLFLSPNRMNALKRMYSPIYAMNMSTGEFYDWVPRIDGFINDVLLLDSNIYLSGDFTKVGTKNVKYLTRFNGFSVEPDSLPLSLNGTGVRTLVADSANIYFTGNFTLVNGQSRIGMALISRSNHVLGPDYFSNAQIKQCQRFEIHGNYLYGVGTKVGEYNLTTHTEKVFPYSNDAAVRNGTFIKVGMYSWNSQYNFWQNKDRGYGIMIQKDTVERPYFDNITFPFNQIAESSSRFLIQSANIDMQYRANNIAAYRISTGEVLDLGFDGNPVLPQFTPNNYVSKIEPIDHSKILIHGSFYNNSFEDSIRSGSLFMYDLISKTVTPWEIPFSTINGFGAYQGVVGVTSTGNLTHNGQQYAGVMFLDTAANPTIYPPVAGVKIMRFISPNDDSSYFAYLTFDSLGQNYTILATVNMARKSVDRVPGVGFGNSELSTFYFNDSFKFYGFDWVKSGTTQLNYMWIEKRWENKSVKRLMPPTYYSATSVENRLYDGNLYITVRTNFESSLYFDPEENYTSWIQVIDPITLHAYAILPAQFTYNLNATARDKYGMTFGGGFSKSTFSNRKYLQKIPSSPAVLVDLPENEYCGYPDTLKFYTQTLGVQSDSVGVVCELLQLINGSWVSVIDTQTTIKANGIQVYSIPGQNPIPGQYRLVATLATMDHAQTMAYFTVYALPNSKIQLTESPSQCLVNNAFTLSDTFNSTSVMRNWYIDAVLRDSTQTLSYSAQNIGKVSVVLVVEDTNHCIMSDSMELELHPNPSLHSISFTQDTVCWETEGQLNADSLNTSWTYHLLNQGLYLDSNSLGSFTISDTQFYKIEARNQFGCSDISDSARVFWYTKPFTPQISGLDSLYVMDSAWYSANRAAGQSLVWNSSAQVLQSEPDSVWLRWTAKGMDTIHVFAENDHGCNSDTSSFTVRILPNPIIPDTLVVSPDTLFANAWGDTLSAYILANLAWEIESKPSWLSTNMTRGLGTDSLNVIVQENTGTATRSDWIIFNADTSRDSVLVIQSSHVGVQHIKTSKLVIYPNPSTGLIKIENASQAQVSIKVYNLKGQCVWNGSVNASEQINIQGEGWMPGVYTFELNDGESREFRKIIIIH